MREVAEQGKTGVDELVDERMEGAIALADVIRPKSREALARLKSMGIQVMCLPEMPRRWRAGWRASSISPRSCPTRRR